MVLLCEEENKMKKMIMGLAGGPGVLACVWGGKEKEGFTWFEKWDFQIHCTLISLLSEAPLNRACLVDPKTAPKTCKASMEYSSGPMLKHYKSTCRYFRGGLASQNNWRCSVYHSLAVEKVLSFYGIVQYILDGATTAK